MLTLAASGATVAAAARHLDRLDEVVAAAPQGSTVHRVQLDLTLEDSCRAAVKEAVSDGGATQYRCMERRDSSATAWYSGFVGVNLEMPTNHIKQLDSSKGQ